MDQIDFEINTFGYGSDHDPLELNGISQLRNGNFFYVTELKRISEYFILSLSALLNAVVDNASISFELNDYLIHKVYGAENVWKKNHATQTYEICQPHLIEGDLKQYVCEIMRNPNKNKDSNSQNIARLKGRILQVSKQNEEIEYSEISSVGLEEGSGEEDIRDICINHLRAKGAEAIFEARLRANLDRFESAQQILNDFIHELNVSPYSQDYMLDSLKNDLQKAVSLCQKEEFQAEGQAFMIRKERNLLKRSGSISSGLGWTEGQQEIMQEYKEGKLALSDDSCPSRYGDDKQQSEFNDDNDIKDELINDDATNNFGDVKDIDLEDSNYEQLEYEEFNRKVKQGIKIKKQNCINRKYNLLNSNQQNHNMIDESDDNYQDQDNNQYEQDDQQNSYDNSKVKDEEDEEEQDENNNNNNNNNEDEDEEEEEIVLSSLAQKLMNKNGNIDKVCKKNS